MPSEPYEILTGVGDLYIALTGTTFPDVDETPGSAWLHLGETQDGVKVTQKQKTERLKTDQRMGTRKIIRTDEELSIETKLAFATLENMGRLLGGEVTDTPAGSGTIGTRKVGLSRGEDVALWALLFRGDSPYGNYPAQYEVPYGMFDGDAEMEFKSDSNAPITMMFSALEDPDAANEHERFGRWVAQDAAALP